MFSSNVFKIGNDQFFSFRHQHLLQIQRTAMETQMALSHVNILMGKWESTAIWKVFVLNFSKRKRFVLNTVVGHGNS